MKFIDEVDIELVNQELNFHSQDDNLLIRGGCDLFTTKPVGTDRKLFKTIDKHLDQIMEDNHISQSLEREYYMNGSSISPPTNSGHYVGSRRSSSFRSDDKSTVSTLNFGRNTPSGSHNLESNLSRSLGSSASTALNSEYAVEEDEDSPFGPLKDSTTRKTFAYLIAILNNTYPDHDFSSLQPTTENFHKLGSPDDLIHKFNNIMISLGKKEELLNWIWDTVNAYMDFRPAKNYSTTPNTSRKNSVFSGASSIPRRFSASSVAHSPTTASSDNCQIFEFHPSDQSILEDLNYPYQTMWSCYWFIYNKKKKRVSFIYLNALTKAHYTNSGDNQNIISKNLNASSTSTTTNQDELAEDQIFMNNHEDFSDVDDDIDDDVIGDIEI